MKKPQKKLYLQKRKRYLKKIVGSALRPRLSVFKSHKHIYAQLIDDKKAHTLVSASTLIPEIKISVGSTATQAAAILVGQKIADLAKKKEIKKIIFDRNNYPYHGRVRSLAEGARNNGLDF